MNEPITQCAWCRKILVDKSKDLWQEVDEAELKGQEVNHGMCQECFDKMDFK